MLRLCPTRQFVSRHLMIVPKSAPPPPPYAPPSTRVELLEQLRSHKPSELPLIMDSLKTLLPSLFPRDFVLVGTFLAKQQNVVFLRRAVLDRIGELSFDLRTLLKLAKKFPQSQTVVRHLVQQPHHCYSLLTPREVVQLMFLCPNNRDVHKSVFGLSPRNLTFYQMASIGNFFRKKKISSYFFDLMAKEIVHRHSTLTAAPRDVALLLNAYCSLGDAAFKELFLCLEKNSFENHESFGPIEIPIVLHAFTKSSSVDSSRLFGVWQNWLCSNIAKLDPKGIGMIAYSFAQMNPLCANEKLYSQISEYMQRNIDVFSLHSIAMVVFGFSKLRFRDPALVALIDRELRWRQEKHKLGEYSLSDVAMLAKGFALMGASALKSTDVLMTMIKKNEKNDARSIVKLIEAFSNFNTPEKDRFDAWIARVLPPILPQLCAREVNSVLGSFVKLGVKNRVLLDAILTSVESTVLLSMKLIPQFTKLTAKLDMYDRALVVKCSKLVSVHLRSFDCEELLDFVQGLSQMNHRDEKILARVMQAIEFQLEHHVTSPAQLVVLLNSVTRLRVGSLRLHEILLKQVFENLSLFTSERLVCNSLFALATGVSSGDINNEWTEPIMEGLLEKLTHLPNMSLEGIRQVQIFAMFQKMTNQNIPTVLNSIEQVNTFAAVSPSIEQSSATHREISRFLSLLGHEHRNEVVWGPFSLDIMLANNRVIEIDGPHHFFRNSAIRTSSSLLKHRLMVQNGMHVKHIPYQEWLQCTNESRKLLYISTVVDELSSADQLDS